ncbi:hypothetical protein SpCBS45565_g02605 [Spizellomyces sp. 'palustris']|nr:hypothetical protein SpCBS45565_g02605 [Spizellomyces sp. 'palustris']
MASSPYLEAVPTSYLDHPNHKPSSHSITMPQQEYATSTSSILPLAYGPDSSEVPAQPKTRRVLSLLLATNLCTLIFTVIPVLVELPNIKGNWYVGNDVIRLLEPIVAMPLYFAVILESGIFSRGSTKEKYLVGTLFMISAAIYQQGAGFHSAANMFKHPFVDFMDENPDLVSQYSFFNDFRTWVRTDWEHGIAHYMYAAGGILMAFVIAYLYRNVHDPMRSSIDKVLFVAATLVYGLIIGSVAIEFPKGSIVALVLVVVYGFGVIGSFLFRREGKQARRLGRRYVLQYYLLAYVVAFIIVLGWVAHVRGFGNREDAGIKF